MIHFKSLKRILCYLKKKTKEYSIKYSRNWNGETTHAFADANWANDKIDRNSVSGILVKLGYNDLPIILKSSKQKTVALSSCEAEYMALALCVQEVSMVMNIFNAIGLDYSVKVFSENLSAKHLVDNPIITQRSKHIDIKYHFVRKFFKFDYVRSELS